MKLRQEYMNFKLMPEISLIGAVLKRYSLLLPRQVLNQPLRASHLHLAYPHHPGLVFLQKVPSTLTQHRQILLPHLPTPAEPTHPSTPPPLHTAVPLPSTGSILCPPSLHYHRPLHPHVCQCVREQSRSTAICTICAE